MQNRYIYHYCAVNGNESMSGIAQLTFRIVSQSDVERLKKMVSADGFTADAINSLSYLGREQEGGFMTTNLSNEQLIKKLQRRIAVAASYPDVEEAQFDAAIFKIALASLEAEPVGWMTDVEVDELHRGISEEAYIYRLPDSASTIPLYAAPKLPAEPVSQSYRLPDGWVMAPKEPTQAMCAAFNDSDYGRKSLRERYSSMLAAAPQLPGNTE